MNQTAASTLQDAYISVEVADSGLDFLRESLRSLFGASGVGCELASNGSHVSIAYGEGEIAVEALERLASEIAALPFSVRVASFEFLEGLSTPFDYLVVNLEGAGAFRAAVEAVEGCMKTKAFAGGFRSHISLLKFRKGALPRAWAEEVIAEMNACQSAVHALGRRVCLQGAQVSVFGADRCRQFSKFFQAA